MHKDGAATVAVAVVAACNADKSCEQVMIKMMTTIIMLMMMLMKVMIVIIVM